MDRVSLGGGKWFDRDKAVRIDEGTWWDGNNHISRVTGSQWAHESLFYTRKGCWVLCESSQWGGVKTEYSVIPDERALVWLLDNELPDSSLAGLPEAVRLSLLEGMKGQEA